MIKTRPGYYSTNNGVLLMNSDAGYLVPYVHADSIIEWLELNGFKEEAERVQSTIRDAFFEFAEVREGADGL